MDRMALFARSSLPDNARRSLNLTPDDRVLTAAELTDGTWAVATRTTLAVTGNASPSRAWCDVDRAAYDPLTSSITVEWVDGGPSLVLELAGERGTAFARTLRERVQSSVILAETLTFPGDRRVRVAVRRSADRTLFSQVVADPGVDLDDPAVSAVVDAAENRVRQASGLPL